MKKATFTTIFFLVFALNAFSQPVKPHTFSPADPVSSSKINANFDTIYQWGSVASAAIELHKADTAAHGATGAVVGTTNTQTLTNKSISGEQINSGTVADARVASTLARDSEVTSAVSTHAALTATHGATGAVVGTTNTQTLTNKTLGTTNSVDGGAIKTGTVADARIDSALARDSEVTSAVSTHAGLVNTHGFYSSNSSTPINPNNTTINGLYYCNSVSLFGQTDGALYSQAHSSAWQGQIYQDYRTGQLAIRGKNNGAWQAWRTVRDSSNFVAGTAAANYCAGNDSRLSDARTPVAHNHSGAEITSGTVADARIDSAIARDSEVTSAVSTHAGLTATHGATGAIMGTTNTQTAYSKTLYASSDTSYPYWHKNNDGSGSGLDADTLDGANSSAFASTAVNNTYAYLGATYISGGTEKPNYFGSGKLKPQMLSGGNVGAPDDWNDCLWLSSYSGGDVKGSNVLIFGKYTDSIGFCRQNYDSTTWGTYRKIWHSGNQGNGSGLDADLLDGYNASSTRNLANSIPVRDASGYLHLGWINTTSGNNGTTAPDRIYASSDAYIRYYTPDNFKTVMGLTTATAGTANTVALRDGSGDITTRLFRSTFAEQTTAPATTADIAFRNDTSNNYIRFMDAAAFKAWLINSKIGVVQTSAPASPVDGDIWVE